MPKATTPHDAGGRVDVGDRDAQQFARQPPAVAAAARVEHALHEPQPQRVGRPLRRRDLDARAVPEGGGEEREEDDDRRDPRQQRPGVRIGDGGVERRADEDRHERLERLVGAEQRRRTGDPRALPAQRGQQQPVAAQPVRLVRAAGTTIGAPVSGQGTTRQGSPKTDSTSSASTIAPGSPSATIAPSRIAIRWVA